MTRTSDSLLGRQLATLTFPIESGKIAEFARATANSNTEYSVRETGNPKFAPLTFSVASRLYSTAGDALQAVKDLGMDVARVVHGSQEWIYHRPVVAGQTLVGTPTVTEVYTKPARAGGEMLFVMLETVFRDEDDGAAVITERMLSIQLPEKEEAP